MFSGLNKGKKNSSVGIIQENDIFQTKQLPNKSQNTMGIGFLNLSNKYLIKKI